MLNLRNKYMPMNPSSYKLYYIKDQTSGVVVRTWRNHFVCRAMSVMSALVCVACCLGIMLPMLALAQSDVPLRLEDPELWKPMVGVGGKGRGAVDKSVEQSPNGKPCAAFQYSFPEMPSGVWGEYSLREPVVLEGGVQAVQFSYKGNGAFGLAMVAADADGVLHRWFIAKKNIEGWRDIVAPLSPTGSEHCIISIADQEEASRKSREEIRVPLRIMSFIVFKEIPSPAVEGSVLVSDFVFLGAGTTAKAKKP